MDELFGGFDFSGGDAMADTLDMGFDGMGGLNGFDLDVSDAGFGEGSAFSDAFGMDADAGNGSSSVSEQLHLTDEEQDRFLNIDNHTSQEVSFQGSGTVEGYKHGVCDTKLIPIYK